MYVLKASGRIEKFDEGKIKKTCLRAGASKEFTNEVVNEVKRMAYNGISTREILNITLNLLRKEHPGVSARYDLKRAIMSLGPTGYPFEKFFSEVLENYGYETQVEKILKGKCVSHEIDIIAEKNRKRYMIECKYHNEIGCYTELKVSLYTYARFLDLEGKFDEPWLVCNTKLTNEAIKYSKCVGMKVTSWGYPQEESLERMIEEKKLYPITILKSINTFEKEKLIEGNLLLAKDLLEYEIDELKKRVNLQKNAISRAVEEANYIFYH